MLAETFAGGAQLLHFSAHRRLRARGRRDERVSLSVISARPRSSSSWRPAQFLELAFLFFDLFLLALELEQLFLALSVPANRGARVLTPFVFVEFEHLFDRADAFRHGEMIGGGRYAADNNCAGCNCQQFSVRKCEFRLIRNENSGRARSRAKGKNARSGGFQPPWAPTGAPKAVALKCGSRKVLTNDESLNRIAPLKLLLPTQRRMLS